MVTKIPVVASICPASDASLRMLGAATGGVLRLAARRQGIVRNGHGAAPRSRSDGEGHSLNSLTNCLDRRVHLSVNLTWLASV
jgi:hypothetical protein